jgi:hypothetical protein
MVRNDHNAGSGSADDLRLLARKSANALRERDLFGEKRLYVPTLLKNLGLRLRVEDNLQLRGTLEEDEIIVREERTHRNTRLVILHEIGHAVLLKDFPCLAAKLSNTQHEIFAKHFAVSMLLPEAKRAQLPRLFRELNSPAGLVRSAEMFGLSVAMFLQVVSWDGEAMVDSDNIWLRVKLAANRYTNLDRKLRIIAAHFDPGRWYIPSNKGFDGIIADTNWLLDIRIGEERCIEEIKVRIQQVVRERAMKYRWIEPKAKICAMALRPVMREHGPHLLVLLNLLHRFK